MQMKKLLACLIALMLTASVALADVQVRTFKVETNLYLATGTNCFYARASRDGGGYAIFDANRIQISEVYADLTAKQGGLYYEYPGSGLNYIGLLDAQGQKLCEPTYGDLRYINDAWIMGFVLEATDAENGDYSNRTTGEQYMVVRTDVLYEGRVIGSLTRDEFDPSWRYGQAGNYIYVRKTDNSGFWIDKNFNITHVEKDFSSSEFSSQYKKTDFHNPTQQYAYCAGCTLTADEVSAPVWYDKDNLRILDLQGNVVKENVVLDQARVQGDYLLVRRNDLYGVMDFQGNLVIDIAYDEFGTYDGLFANDAQVAITPEGYLHYLNKQGEITAKAEYALSTSDYKGFGYSSDFVVVSNMGQYIVITSQMGELPVKYEDVSTPRTGHKVLLVKQDGLWGGIDVWGQTVVPFVHKYAPEMTNDSAMIYGYDAQSTRYLYQITTVDATPTAEPAAAPTEAPAAEPTAAPESPAVNDNAWTCTCGSVNTGKFCPECGGAKPEPTPTPVPDNTWTCACGSVNTGKFCPECGTARPAEAPKCASCGYTPEGDAPKFCPECGTKF